MVREDYGLIIYENGGLVDTESGEIYCPNTSPRFQQLTYKDYVDSFPQIRYISAQCANEADKDNIPEEGYVAEQKFDGTRCTCFITPEGNRMFSRRISKKTDWFAENTDTMPHIRDYLLPEFFGTVIDGEITLGNDSNDVLSVTGSLPEKALQNQIEKGFAAFKVFDVLYYKGIKVEKFPLHERLKIRNKFFQGISHPCIEQAVTYSTMGYKNTIKVPSFRKLLEQMWSEGKEGLMIKSINAPYEEKRGNNYLKLKPHFLRDGIIMGYTEPTKTFKEDERKTDLSTWEFWEGDVPVTKPYAKGWIGAVRVGVFKNGKLEHVCDAKGLSDEKLEYIKQHKDEMIGEVIEIEFNDFIDKETYTPRHPRVSRFRTDKNAEECTFENWKNG